MEHTHFMQLAFKLAYQGAGFVSPNPLVGAVIVKDSKIISTGFHKKYGGFHAELDAILSAQEPVVGATLYCNLEPCCHADKKTPPCAQRIIAEGITKVVIANKDPNPSVNGAGIELLRSANIEVIENICSEQGRQLNEFFFTYHTKKRPFICLKYAQTLDGNIACLNGDSKWISNKSCIKKVHQMRTEYDAILIGSGTLKTDNPRLTIREYESEKICPVRVVVGSLKHVSFDHHIISDEFAKKTVLITSAQDQQEYQIKANQLFEKGISIVTVPREDTDRLDLTSIGRALHERRINSVLVEGGSKILTSYVQQNLYDRISIFIAPKIVGTGLKAIDNLGINYMKDAISFDNGTFEPMGDCIYFTASKPWE